MGDGLLVSGGAGSLDAPFDDMLATADVLDTSADTLRELGLRVAGVAVSGDLIESAVLAPVTAARVQAQVAALVAGPESLAGLAVRLEAHAFALRAIVEGYRAADAARAQAIEAAQFAVGLQTGLALGAAPVVAAAGGTVLTVQAATVLPVLAGTAFAGDVAVRFGQNLVETAPPWPLAGIPVLAPVWTWRAGTGTVEDVRDDVDAATALGQDLLSGFRTALPGLATQAADGVQDTLFEHPGLVDTITGGSAGLVTGLTLSPLGLLFTATGGGPAARYEDAVARLRGAGSWSGIFNDGTPGRVERAAPPLAPDGTPLDPEPPSSVESLFGGIGSLGMPGGQDQQTGPYAGRVRVFQVPQPDGTSRWVVEIPGTQTWPTTPGPNPFDLAGNVTVMADGTSTAAAGVRQALRAAMADAGVPPGQPVLLAGHSQGGIVAAALAADPGFRAEFDVDAVVTGGSPIARFAIPEHVTVLSLEHVQDPVPRLEGTTNPDRDSWVTVTRDVADHPRVTPGRPVDAHGTAVYGDTATLVDHSTDPGITGVRDALAPFLSGGATSSDYVITRTTP